MSSVKLKCEKKDLLCFICHENKWSLFNVNVLDVRQQIASIFNVEIKIAKNYKLCSSCEFNLKILHLANVLSSPSSSSSASSNSSTTKLTTTTTTIASTTTTTTQKTTTSKNSNNNCLCGLITDNNDIYDPNKAPPNTINNNRKEQTYFKELKKKFYKHLKINCEIRRKMNIACKNSSTSTSKTIHQKYDEEQKQQQQQQHRYCLFNEIKIPRHIYNDNKLFNCKVAVVNNRGNDLIRLCMKREWSPTLPPKRRKMIDDDQKDNGIIVNENNIISNKLDSNSNDISNKKNDNNINDIKQQNCINNNNVDNVDKITNECNEKKHPANETDTNTNTNKTTTKRVTFSDKIEYVPFDLNPSITADTLNRFAKFSIFKSLKKTPLSSENSTEIDEAAVNQPNENETLTKTNGLSSENSTEIDEAAVNQPNENETLTKTNGLSNELDLVVVAVSNQDEKQKTEQLNVEKKNVEKVDDDDDHEKENEVDKIEATSKNSLSTKNIRNIDGIVADTSKTNKIVDSCNVVEKDATQPQHKDLSKTSSNELSENKGNNGNGDGNINDDDDDEPSTNNIDNSNKKQQHNNDINFIDSYLIHLSSNIRLTTTSLCKTTTNDATKLPPCNDNENCDNIQEIYSSSSSSPSTDNTKTSSIDNNIPKEINKNESHFPEQILSDS